MTTYDNEYLILSEIADDATISQRVLSKRIGISLGTVNTLLTKMAKEGIIKIEQVSKKQVIYMLTPKGIIEKSKKTVSYLKSHYKTIYIAKENIKTGIDNAVDLSDKVYVIKQSGELGDIVDIAISEYPQNNKVSVINNLSDIKYQTEHITIINATENKLTLEQTSNIQVIDIFI